jgi:predicted nucleic acid-binding protein
MLLDSNLIIYASQLNHAALRSFIAREVPCVSAVSKVETPGYHELTDGEKQFLEEFFREAEVVGGSQSIIAEAIQIRQQRSMSLGDALIDGTALNGKLKLATHSTKNFEWVEELELIDPLAGD